MSNYPPGSEDDPNAPWNCIITMVECPNCDALGTVINDDEETVTCPECEGTCEVERQSE